MISGTRTGGKNKKKTTLWGLSWRGKIVYVAKIKSNLLKTLKQKKKLNFCRNRITCAFDWLLESQIKNSTSSLRHHFTLLNTNFIYLFIYFHLTNSPLSHNILSLSQYQTQWIKKNRKIAVDIRRCYDDDEEEKEEKSTSGIVNKH